MSFEVTLLEFMNRIHGQWGDYGNPIRSIEVSPALYSRIMQEAENKMKGPGKCSTAYSPDVSLCKMQFGIGNSVIEIKKSKNKVKYADYLTENSEYIWTRNRYEVGRQPVGSILIPGSEAEVEE